MNAQSIAAEGTHNALVSHGHVSVHIGVLRKGVVRTMQEVHTALPAMGVLDDGLHRATQ